jgi:hypothetical protein
MALGMMNLLLDWHSLGRWGSCVGLRGLLADEGGIPSLPLPRYVLRWLCWHCEQLFLSTDTEAQPCPQCGRTLAFVAKWDLCAERAPRWWADPGARGTR